MQTNSKPMGKEIEAKFFIDSKDKIREKLSKNGLILAKKERLIKRKIFHNNEVGKYLRVRDEGDKITMTYKSITTNKSINGVEEVEIIVNDFDSAVELINKTNFKEVSYQETLRESWNNSEVEVDIDTWPYLQSFIEIEAKTEDLVKKYTRVLDFDFEHDAYFGGTDILYNKVYNIDKEIINKLPVITFDNEELEKFFSGKK